MSEPFDPYRKWLGIPPQDQPPHHYRLLGISPFEDDPDVIENAANRQMQHVRTYQQGRNAAHSQRILNELSAAKLTLLDEKKKSSYDKLLRRELKLRKQAAVSGATSDAGEASESAGGAPPPVIPVGSLPRQPGELAGTSELAPPPMGIPLGSPSSGTHPFPAGGLPVPRAPTRATRRGRGRRKSSPWPLVLGMIAVVIVIGVLIIALSQTPPEPSRQGATGLSQPTVAPRQMSPGTRSQGAGSESPRQFNRPPSRRLGPPARDDARSSGLPELPTSDPTPGVDEPGNDRGVDASSPFGASLPAGTAFPPVATDRFEEMVSAARRAMADRDYQSLRDFSRQVNQEKQAGDAEQVAIAAHLDAIRALLDEFATGVRRALVRNRTGPESFEAFGHQLVLEPRADGVTSYTFDGESREFAIDRFYDALRGAAAEELAVLADIGWRGEKAGEPENALDRNYRRIYVALFLAVDNPENAQREEFLERAVDLWRESADEGTDHPVLRKELQDAGALAAE